jgi:hypothetical protein
MRLFLKVCCWLLVLAGIAFAQTGGGTITGTITDPAGAVAPGADIKAKNIATTAEYRTVSTSTGNYNISQLPPGTYELAVSMAGFKTFVRQGITVATAQILRIDVTDGRNHEVVTVSADAPLLKTESGELSHNVKTDALDTLLFCPWHGGAGPPA